MTSSFEPPRRRRVKPASPEIRAWELQNSPYTWEGENEALARFATGVRTARPGVQRTVGLVVVFAIVGPFTLGLLTLAWRELVHVFG